MGGEAEAGPKPGDINDRKIAGGHLIPTLLSLVTNVLSKLNYRWAFCTVFVVVASPWELTLSGLLRAQLRGLMVLVSTFCATVASYERGASPFPQCSKAGLDVLMGRTVKISTEVADLHANNNVTIALFKGQYVAAYRRSDVHFPSEHTRLIVTTSCKDLSTWEQTWEYRTGNDLREMLLFEMNSQLLLYFFSLVPEGKIFKPLNVYCTKSTDARAWATPVEACKKSEVPWDIKVRQEASGVQMAYKASYLGDHYGTEDVCVLFERSKDGLRWEPVGESGSVVYRGGVCEVAFEFTNSGDLVALGRNEDGDASGFGTQLFFARADDLGSWTALSVSLPWRFDSPRMLRTDGGGGELLLFSRYAPERYQLAPSWLPFNAQKTLNLILYSLSSKSAGVFRIKPPQEWATGDATQSAGSGGENPEGRHMPVELVRLFEQAFGDTGFFSVARDISGEPDEWVVANYSSHCHSHAPWIYGQFNPTHIYACRCKVRH